MNKFGFLGSVVVAAFAAVLAVTAGATVARAQNQGERKIKPTAADVAAAKEARVIYRRVSPANTPAGKAFKSTANTASPKLSSGFHAGELLRYPGDVTYFGGPVVDFAESHPIYLLPNEICTIATCPLWGNPEGFLTDLGQSQLAHIVDQYVGLSAKDRYTLGQDASILSPLTTPFSDADMQVFVAAAVASGIGQAGYGHIYHVFLPPGQDICVTATFCYSPDNPSTFVFCAYHSSVDFPGIGHLLYTVEPFQNVLGCSVRPGTPNGQLIDSTDSILSHETLETISDPDGDAWFNFGLVVLLGDEIGDECSFFVIPTGFFDPSVFKIGKHDYGVQLEYSNVDHACGSAP